ncbi:hypothetical protein ACSBR1_025623 [Camellia fascicularis]
MGRGWVPAHFPHMLCLGFSSHSHSDVGRFNSSITLISSSISDLQRQRSSGGELHRRYHGKLDGRDSELQLLRGYTVYLLRTGLQLELFLIFNASIIHRNSPRIPDQRSCSFIY